MHASALLNKSTALIICGDSGSGKSSLAALMAIQGATILTDDLCIVGQSANELPQIIPLTDSLKIDESFVSSKNINRRHMISFDEDTNKYRFRVREHHSNKEDYNKIVLVLLQNKDDKHHTILKGGDALKSIYYHSGVPGALLTQEDKVNRGEKIITLLKQSEVHMLNRYGQTDYQLVSALMRLCQ